LILIALTHFLDINSREFFSFEISKNASPYILVSGAIGLVRESDSVKKDTGFNGKISSCIDKALDTLGSGVKQSFYYQISQSSRLPRDLLSFKPDEVIESLRQILGPTGSSFIEKLIVREISCEFALEFEDNQPLHSAIESARKKFLDVSD
jgi:hypothetical protein